MSRMADLAAEVEQACEFILKAPLSEYTDDQLTIMLGAACMMRDDIKAEMRRRGVV